VTGASAPSGIEPARARSRFGQLLRRWRHVRALSQLELAVRASTTPRHVSFLETGRSRPRRELVVRLLDVLAVPPGAHDDWFLAAGLAAPAVAPVAFQLPPHSFDASGGQLALPAVVVSAGGEIQSVNTAARQLLPGIERARTLVDAFTTDPLRAALANPDEVAWTWHDRLASSLDDADRAAHAALADLEARLRGVPRPPMMPASGALQPTIRHGARSVAMISLTTRLWAGPNARLPWAVEILYPIDGAAERTLAEILDDLRQRRS
jgi:transcriptional regulator with XRE-family HTH domain